MLSFNSRSVEPKARNWLLLAKTKKTVEESIGHEDTGSRASSASLGVDVDGSKFH